MRTTGSCFRNSIAVLSLAITLLLLVACAPAITTASRPAGTPKPGEVLHLVMLGDFQNYGFGESDAGYLEADLSVKVELNDLTSGGYTPANLLNDLRNGSGSRMGIQPGKYEDHMRCWEAWNSVIHQAAADHRVPIAEVFAAFNGPSREQDPKDKGLQGDDGLPNEAGNKLIADQLRKLGYDSVVP